MIMRIAHCECFADDGVEAVIVAMQVHTQTVQEFNENYLWE